MPTAFLDLAHRAAAHTDPQRWALLYRVLWRLTLGGERHLLALPTDRDVRQVLDWNKAIGRDIHKMHAFVRFRLVGVDPATHREQFVAWFEPDFRIVRLAAPFFEKRFAGMDWSILTPHECAHWDGQRLHFTPGVTRAMAPEGDVLDDLWRTYYKNIFNPARVKISAMQSEMPKKYWKNLPEAPLIADLIAESAGRVQGMFDTPERPALPAPHNPYLKSLHAMNQRPPAPLRHLVLVLGDQLNPDSAAFDGFDPAQDAVWMAEVAHETHKVGSSQVRTAVFLSAMRHFRDARRAQGWQVIYRELTSSGGHWHSPSGPPLASSAETFAEALAESTASLHPQQWIAAAPGEWSVQEALGAAAAAANIPLDIREDRHFLCSRAQFAAHTAGRKQLRLEFFYREMRQRHAVLMDQGQPVGGAWNFDSENRKSFPKNGPPPHRPPLQFPPDALTRQVIATVQERFPSHPGDLAAFDWPVTPEDAEQALADFVEHRLAAFGDWQDAMWTAEPWLFHSRLSAAMNLKLLDPRRVLAAAEASYQQGRAPLAAVEGFIRQILGWREYVRGIYWHHMPAYADRNALGADQPLPPFYWTGQTDLACLRDALDQTLRLGYAHHIQRLMVTGLYALMLGVRPREVHQWYLAVYVDAVEWVELPNVLGMSQHADGGLMASKPYIASGKYIQRMSNYCSRCPYNPAESTGPTACPFTTLYWDFLLQHEPTLRQNHRMAMQVKNLARLDETQRRAIQAQAAQLRHPTPAGDAPASS